MRILILANNDVGLYKFRQELIEALVKEHKVYFCVPEGEFVGTLRELGAKYIPVNNLDRRGTNPVKDMKLILFYQRTLKKLKPDIVLTYTIKPNVYGGLVCGRMKIPYIANVTGLGTAIENGGILAFISKTLYKAGLRKAKCVFFQNKENQKLFLKERIIKGKTKLIPGSGVNIERYSLKEYPADSKETRFLFVGRIMKDKGIDELLQAMKKLHSEYCSVILDIVGSCDEDYSGQLSVAEKEGTIVYHGMQSDVRPFYEKCQCTVLPSYHEGMANVLLEASATGRPVITTRVSGCKETFDEGITGFGCFAKDIDSLYEAMKRFVELDLNTRREMGLAARTKMEKVFDRKIVIDAYCKEIVL